MLKDQPIVEDGLCGYNCPYFYSINEYDALCLLTEKDIVYYDGFHANCNKEGNK